MLSLTGENIRVEFKPTLAQILDTDGDGIPDFYEGSHGLDPNVNEGALADLDGDGFTNVQEYQRGSNPQLATSTPTSASGMATPPIPPAGGPGGGGMACGSAGLDLMWPLALLWLRRRNRRA